MLLFSDFLPPLNSGITFCEAFSDDLCLHIAFIILVCNCHKTFIMLCHNFIYKFFVRWMWTRGSKAYFTFVSIPKSQHRASGMFGVRRLRLRDCQPDHNVTLFPCSLLFFFFNCKSNSTTCKKNLACTEQNEKDNKSYLQSHSQKLMAHHNILAYSF